MRNIKRIFISHYSKDERYTKNFEKGVCIIHDEKGGAGKIPLLSKGCFTKFVAVLGRQSIKILANSSSMGTYSKVSITRRLRLNHNASIFKIVHYV